MTESLVGQRTLVPIMMPIEGKICPYCEKQLYMYADEVPRYGIILGHCEECGTIFPFTKREPSE